MLKNVNLIIVKGLSRKRINKQRKKKQRKRGGGGGLIEIVRSLSLSQASVMFFSIKYTISLKNEHSTKIVLPQNTKPSY